MPALRLLDCPAARATTTAPRRPLFLRTPLLQNLFLLTALSLAGAGIATAAEPAPPGNRCDKVVAGGPIDYRGKKLLETADIATPEIRRINVLISTRCYREAREAIDRYRLMAPRDHQIEFVETRLNWIQTGTDEAEQAITALLAEHPDFASLKVLQASLLMERKRYAEASAVLDEVARRMPNDLWLQLDRLLIELRQGPGPDIAKRLQPILDNPQFPPSAREAMGLELVHLPGIDKAVRASAYRTLLTFESATPFARKMLIFAHELVLEYNDPDTAIELLNRAIADPRGAGVAEQLKIYLSTAYLQKAIAIDARSTPRNAGLIAKGAEQFGTCWLQRNMAYVPDGARLRALLDDWVKAEQRTDGC